MKLFKKEIFVTIIVVYSICFIAFSSYYWSDYATQIGSQFQIGAGECIDAAEQMGKEVYVKDISYPKVLFYSKTSPREYLDTVEYSNYPSAYLDAVSFGKYHFGIDETTISAQSAYVFKTDSMDVNLFIQAGLTVESSGEYSLAY